MSNPSTVILTMQVPYELSGDGRWRTDAETIDDQTLRDRQQAAAEAEETRCRRERVAASPPRC